MAKAPPSTKFDPNTEAFQMRAQWKKVDICRKQWHERWSWLLDERKQALAEAEKCKKLASYVMPLVITKLESTKTLKPVPVTSTGFIGWLASNTTPVHFANDNDDDDDDDDGDSVNAQNNNLSIEPELVEDKKNNCGRRIVNVSQFFNQLQDVSCHGPLNSGLKSVEIISETHTGLVSQFKLKCNMCNMTFSIHNDNPIDDLDLNSGAVAGTVTIGCGYRQLTELSAAIGFPPMSKNTFLSKMASAHKTWESELLKSMMEAAEEERRLAIEEGRVNSDGIAIIDVIADGCY